MEKLKNSVFFPFARSSSPKQKKERLTAGQGLQAISTLVVHLFIAEYLNIWKSQLFRVGGPIKWLLLVVNKDAEHRSIIERNNSFAHKEVFERETF